MTSEPRSETPRSDTSSSDTPSADRSTRAPAVTDADVRLLESAAERALHCWRQHLMLTADVRQRTEPDHHSERLRELAARLRAMVRE
jgi:hypothetical protein